MLHKLFTPGDWFAPKRFGYGAGWPIAWQGWALILAYIGLVAGLVRLAGGDRDLGPLFAPVGVIAATIVLIVAARRHTRGEWRWRWGEQD